MTWLRLSRQRSLRKILLASVLGCWGMFLLRTVVQSNEPIVTYSSLEDKDTSSLYNSNNNNNNNNANVAKATPSNVSSPHGQDDFKSTMEKRLQMYRQACENKWTDTFVGGKMSLIFYDNNVKMGYCFVAKVGCTYWFRLLSFLTRKKQMKELKITSPLDIDRSKLHTGELGPAKWQYIQNFKKVVQPSTLKFLFSRNPYERLWSVYLDKYYLIDYWVTNPIANTECGKNVTFQMFLEWAVKSTDHHLVPVTTACEPCAFRPDFIGKMETFSQDSKYILNSTGYSYLIKDYTHAAYVNSEIKSLVVYNFKAMRYAVFSRDKCLLPIDICRRMWHVFQMNGFIKDSIPFPEDRSDYSEAAAIDMFLETVHTNPIAKADSKLQRRRSLVKAYSDVTWSTVQAVQKHYSEDFLMFGYDIDPPRENP